MKLTKTAEDMAKEEKDLREIHVLVLLANLDRIKFNVGDVLIKKRLVSDDDGNPVWDIEKDDIGEPVKYVYAFENKLGIGYVKALKKSGKGPHKTPKCLANVHLATEQYMLDPEYVEHLLLGEGGEFKYNASYERALAYRKEAIEKNKAFLVDGDDWKANLQWWKSLAVGSMLWCPDNDQHLSVNGVTTLEVVKVRKDYKQITFRVVQAPGWNAVGDIGDEISLSRAELFDCFDCVSNTKPFPLREDNT
jgi:hypothetical protein